MFLLISTTLKNSPQKLLTKNKYGSFESLCATWSHPPFAILSESSDKR